MCPLFNMLNSCLLIFKLIPVCLSVTLLLSKYGAGWKFFAFASLMLSFYKEIFVFVFTNIAVLLLQSRCICTKDISLAYFVCQYNWSRSGSFDNFGILTLRLLMSYIYIYGTPILDVSRSYTTTHHSR